MYKLLFIIAGCSLTVQATPGLVLPVERTTGLGCIPEGRTVSYECTVTDPSDPPIASTVWQGSAFTCTSSKISFLHSSFEPNGVSGSCGDLSATSVGVSVNEYTSRLALTATAELNGMTINCTLSSVVHFGSDTVKIGASPSPPQSAMVDITSTSSLTVSWTPPSDTSNVGGYMLTVTGEDCGCESMNVSSDTTSVNCSGWMVNDQACSFEVSTISEDCGFPSDSVVPTSIVLSVSSSPSQLSLGDLQQTCSFQSTNAILSWMVPSAMSGHPPVQMYHVMINNGAIMSTSGAETSITIPGSTFPRAGTYSFSVRAVNILGESAPLSTDLDVGLTSVSSSYSVTMMNVTLTFSLSNTDCVVSASVTVYYQECADQVNCQCPQTFSTNKGSTPATEAFVITDLRVDVIYCYRSEVVNDGSIVGFENSQMFSILPPVPPALLANARLVSSDPPTYQCVNSAEGFNGESSQTTALFDPGTGLYSVPPCSIFGWLVAIIVIVFCVVLGAVFTVGFGVGCCFGYRRKKMTPHEAVYEDTDSTREAVYEDTDSSFPTDPRTAGNLAYEHISSSDERSTELRGPIYEEPDGNKSNPQTQGNIAYGHVQFN